MDSSNSTPFSEASVSRIKTYAGVAADLMVKPSPRCPTVDLVFFNLLSEIEDCFFVFDQDDEKTADEDLLRTVRYIMNSTCSNLTSHAMLGRCLLL